MARRCLSLVVLACAASGGAWAAALPPDALAVLATYSKLTYAWQLQTLREGIYAGTKRAGAGDAAGLRFTLSEIKTGPITEILSSHLSDLVHCFINTLPYLWDLKIGP